MFEELAFIQFQYVRHAIPALFKLNDICFYENCCNMDILVTDIGKLEMCYDNVSLLISSIIQSEKFNCHNFRLALLIVNT